MVSSDIDPARKLEIFKEFEDPLSSTRVIFGTKLIPNGLNWSLVDVMVLVDCSVITVAWLQIVGRIRTIELVIKLVPGDKRQRNDNSAENLKLKNMDMNLCPTMNVSTFYGLENKGHELCCNENHKRDAKKIVELSNFLKHVHTEDEVDRATSEYIMPLNCSKLEILFLVYLMEL
ncbi:hypothetical protein KAFR_0B00113 [Kazachstania africana CBS 2517]|uniref:Helicase C-terminal domain-containing protein n=1 Tax=Kazachstania africana (strain ATCC 22294 / BCRC 22015 / CBS 2517 / CECT 1963 / NBRC 1671 / NRRL Y-8276) TaxID=1071382 RepID=H2APL0_KAZAF|nr:hypothetical protein KAFR_0B00113 [Kazachstania africana CBS 2517]CCF56310.1 hypothetical protein KAFR_0B00113 [Kazachstania africana CBS 2517]